MASLFVYVIKVIRNTCEVCCFVLVILNLSYIYPVMSLKKHLKFLESPLLQGPIILSPISLDKPLSASYNFPTLNLQILKILGGIAQGICYFLMQST